MARQALHKVKEDLNTHSVMVAAREQEASNLRQQLKKVKEEKERLDESLDALVMQLVMKHSNALSQMKVRRQCRGHMKEE